mmetsp:Transcript_56977/g.124976  ORF Transcript_56977/g.124976 Transcript_56977/m.124976 type:complete len:221 (-) Transcript_56977:162-824(-)
MSPMSSLIVEISAVTVASTRCRLVMIEWVESSLALISSKSTLTASMAAVKSSISRSHPRTMRLTWAVSAEVLFTASFSSPMSYFNAFKSALNSSALGIAWLLPPRVVEAITIAFLSTSAPSFCIWAVIWASKSFSLAAIRFMIWPSAPVFVRLGLAGVSSTSNNILASNSFIWTPTRSVNSSVLAFRVASSSVERWSTRAVTVRFHSSITWDAGRSPKSF